MWIEDGAFLRNFSHVVLARFPDPSDIFASPKIRREVTESKKKLGFFVDLRRLFGEDERGRVQTSYITRMLVYCSFFNLVTVFQK